jgi:hypothetical protein
VFQVESQRPAPLLVAVTPASLCLAGRVSAVRACLRRLTREAVANQSGALLRDLLAPHSPSR